MAGVCYTGQEAIDFNNYFSDTGGPSYPIVIANDGTKARNGSSPNLCGSLNPAYGSPLVIYLGTAYYYTISNSNITASLNDFWYSSHLYTDGGVNTSIGDVTTSYLVKFDNLSYTDFHTYSIIIHPSGNVYTWNGTDPAAQIGSTMSVGFASSSLQRIDVHIVNSTTGSVTIWLDGTEVYSYSGDITAGVQPGGYDQVSLGSAGGSGVYTYWSEIICTDSTDTRGLYMGYMALVSGDGSYSNVNYGTLFNFPVSVSNPPYYVANDIIYAGQSSVDAFIGTNGAQFFTWFTVNNGGGADITAQYSGYLDIVPTAYTSMCLPRGVGSITGLNILTAASGDPDRFHVSTGPSNGPFSINSSLMHVVYGSGTVNPCITLASSSTNIMIIA